MFTSIGLSIKDNGLIEAYHEVCQHAEDFTNASVNRTMNDSADELLTEFRQEPGPVKTPIKWTSRKQQRYIHMMISKGLIISPYPRTHNTSQGWRVEVVYTPGELTSINLFNTNWYTSFVEGLYQQQFHKNTGWLEAPALAEKWSGIMLDRTETDLIKSWYAVDEGRI